MDARLWWRTIGEPEIPGGSWEDFRTLIIIRYGPLLDRDTAMPYRDTEIYNDMNFGRSLSYVADWLAYLNESMGHYCRRFQYAMLPYIPDLGSPELRALQLVKDGLPPEVRTFVQAQMVGMTLENMINDIMEAELIAHMLQADALVDDYRQEPVDDAGIPEPPFHGGPFLPEDPIPAVLLQEIPPLEEEANAEGNEEDPTDFMAAPEDQPEHPPEIIIASDDDEEDVEEEIKDYEDDPEENLFGDEDWDIFSDVRTE
ncbi:hypothetical protein TIFTF001_029438 [Ficus carica]|uniref:Uncharacterized protein n=1 Tax=Ficus carica TaxID=3494 RepID=A0AA88DRW0_FICCA|nr:hypothetical protein TIFTF001_029438 [Ficus carica]